MSETYVTYRVWDGCKAPINLEYSGRLIGQIARQTTIDRDALLALADRMDRDGKMQRERQKAGGHWFIDGLDVREYARRIREACGEVPDAGAQG